MIEGVFPVNSVPNHNINCRVKRVSIMIGKPVLKNLLKDISFPDSSARPAATTLADAPISSHYPLGRHQALMPKPKGPVKGQGLDRSLLITTGTIVAVYGILS